MGDPWESILTLLMMPLLILVSWGFDRNWFRGEKEEKGQQGIIIGVRDVKDVLTDGNNENLDELAQKLATKNVKKNKRLYRNMTKKMFTNKRNIKIDNDLYPD